MSSLGEKAILQRLRAHGITGKLPICGFHHHDDHAVLRDLERRGLVDTWAGQGADRGLLLARLKAPAPSEATEERSAP